MNIFKRQFHYNLALFQKRLNVKLNSDSLEIPPISNGRFHFAWLRDNCQCPQCFHPRTKQKLYSSGNIDRHIKPLKAEMTGDSLVVSWQDHQSVYTVDWLKKFNYNKTFTPLISPKLWDAATYHKARETVSYSDFLQPHGFKKVLHQIREYGLAFLQNVPTQDHLQVESVAKAFGVIKVLLNTSF